MAATNDWEPTIRSRELGERLRAGMTKAGYTPADMSRALGWSHGRVSRLLSGKRGGNALDVMAFLTQCGIKGDDRSYLMQLCEDLRRPDWVEIAHMFTTLRDYEENSATIDQFEHFLVPGLLQTEDYARAVIGQSVETPLGVINERVRVRMARQAIFDKPSCPRCRFFVHELALMLPIGGNPVMSDQLHHLLRLAVRPHVAIRVVPISAGAHPALGGPFKIMEVRDFKPIIFLDSEIVGHFRETPAEVQRYRAILTALDAIALDRGQSRELITDIAVTRYGEDPDDPDRAGTMA